MGSAKSLWYRSSSACNIRSVVLSLTRLRAQDFRCFKALELCLGPSMNIVHGMNGSGKTSILEAVVFLSLGKSFRSSQARFVILEGSDVMSIHGESLHDGLLSQMGIERSRQGAGRQQLNGDSLTSVAPLAQSLPVCIIHPDRLLFLSGGPKPRRELLDWGLFYWDKAFLGLWQRAQKALKQRNAALRRGCRASEITVWTEMLCEVAPRIDAMRADYLSALGVILSELCETLFDETLSLSWDYRRGWSEDLPLIDVLEQQFMRDSALGYTQSGPQRADFVLQSRGVPAHQVLSQGQQKCLAYAVFLSQMKLLCERQSGILLIDDLPAELDAHRIAQISEIILSMPIQTIITAIDPQSLPLLCAQPDVKMFHVKPSFEVIEG